MSTISGGMLCSCFRKVRMPFRMSPQLKQSSNPFLSSFALQRGRALTFVHSARASRVALGRSFKTLYLYLPRPMHSTAARRFCHAAGSGAVLLSDSSDESVSQSSSSSADWAAAVGCAAGLSPIGCAAGSNNHRYLFQRHRKGIHKGSVLRRETQFIQYASYHVVRWKF